MRFGSKGFGGGPDAEQFGGFDASAAVDHQSCESVVGGLVSGVERECLSIELFGLGELSLFADSAGEVVDVVGVIREVGDSPSEVLAGGVVIAGFVVGQSGVVHHERAHRVTACEADAEADG